MAWAGPAFDNSEYLFLNAFALSDPTPELLNLIRKHPTYHTVVDLLTYYTTFAEKNLSRANSLAFALATVRDSPDAPIIGGTSLGVCIWERLEHIHTLGLDADELKGENRIFGPNNVYLMTSLLSGLSLKYGLAMTRDQTSPIVEGLHAPLDKSATSEIRVIGSCIQLLTYGPEMVESRDEIVTQLEAQKNAGTVKNPNALKVLELTISHAKTGFKEENDVDNVWELLFPSQS
ncbi:hypothetical protein BDZ97DRAFT_1757897 [Flammula alnicola]|nr:hypothetical protein BDZ97DRAFT_1757897 [Flammula alnicola]